MEYSDHVTAVERETRSMGAAFRSAPRDARVPTCPGWVLADLADHVGTFTALWTDVLCEATGAEKAPFASLAETDDLDAWYQPIADRLIDRLRATPADTPSWMWMPDQQTARGVARRCANELSIHRYDAQSAGGGTEPLDAAVALDAVDEIFVMLPAWDNPPDASGKSLLLQATEGQTRTITLGAEGPRVHHERRPADLTLTGTASDLALALFRRPTIRAVRRDGDATALDAWYRDFLFD